MIRTHHWSDNRLQLLGLELNLGGNERFVVIRTPAPGAITGSSSSSCNSNSADSMMFSVLIRSGGRPISLPSLIRT